MNKIGKKFVVISLLLGINCASVNVYASVLHAIKTEETITKGATHIHEQLLMDSGWRNVHVLKVDLEDSNITVGAMESATGVERQDILQMVQDSGAVAGINADYFDMNSKSTPSLGMLIENGSLSHGYNSSHSTLGINKNMATFMLGYDNIPTMDYYGVTIKLNVNGNVVGGALTKNIVPTSISRAIVLDSTYYQTTHAIVEKHPTVYTIVVEEGMVTYQSKSGEGVMIPSNGYVIIVPEAMANEYYMSLPIGTNVVVDEVLYLNSGLTTAVSNMKLGIGGSGIIMRNGVAYTGAAHAVTPNANVARTVIATVKDSNEILLVTIDKNSDYVGINQKELVEVLQRYNAQDAMYFDGGGSTTFVSRDEGSFTATLQNNPTGGAQRKVVNGLGVFSNSQAGNITKLMMTPSVERTFVGETVSFTFKGTDENNNPVVVDPNQISYMVGNGNGNFSGNNFTPTSAGNMVIVASYNGVDVATELIVSEKPTGLIIEPNLIQVGVGETKEVKVYGLDKGGYKILLNANGVTWSSDRSNIQANSNRISGTGEAVGRVVANYKGVEGKAGVIVGSTVVPVESFETNSGAWGGNTSITSGNVFPCEDLAYHGSKSLKMTYTFKPSNNKQVAYTLFNTPIEVPVDAASINMWLHGKNQGHTAKVEVVDSIGKTYYLKLVDTIDFTDWKYTSVALPVEMVLPAKVTKFYTYANSVTKEVTSAVYLDHISITRGFREEMGISYKADCLADPYYKPSLQQSIGSQYIINVVGPTRTDSTILGSESIEQISQRLSNGASAVVKASSKNNQLSLGCEEYTYANSYQTSEYSNTKVIMIGTGSGGIRTTDVNAWTHLKASIEESMEAKHLIIVTSLNPLTQFKDTLEGKAFHDYLVGVRKSTGQNIFVVYAGGVTPEVRIEEGIRYIRTNGINVVTDNYQNGSFVKFKMDGDAVYYTLEQFQ